MSEHCNQCGRSIAWGSGLFVNRVHDFNPVNIRRTLGRPYPEGGYVCRDCDSNSEGD